MPAFSSILAVFSSPTHSPTVVMPKLLASSISVRTNSSSSACVPRFWMNDPSILTMSTPSSRSERNEV